MSYRRIAARLFLLAGVCLISLPRAVTAQNILIADFENRDFDGLIANALCCTHSAKVVSSPARTGNYAVKFTLNSDDAGYISGKWEDPARRAELRKNNTASVGTTRWYGMSIMIDPSWRDDTKDPNGTTVASWHNVSDPGDAPQSGHLGIEVKGNNWEVRNVSDPNAITTSGSSTRRDWNVGPVEKGKWVDWVVFAKWSYGSDGILKVWKDGMLVVDHRGPNAQNDQNPEFFKFGIYKSWWAKELPPTRNTLIAYHDSIKIGDHNSSYNQVAPKNSVATLPAAPSNLSVVKN